MAILLRELAQGFDRLARIGRDAIVQDALKLMFPESGEYFSQLPVVDPDHHLIGVISEHSIVEAFREQSNRSYDFIAKLTVRQCLERDMSVLSPDDDIFAAMRRLERASYVMVVDGGILIGIVTSYDTGNVFGPMGEVLVKARDVEERLREYIVRAFPGDILTNEAIARAFPGADDKSLDRLTFGDLLEVIWNGTNWRSFERVLGPQDMFRRRMKPARDIRNAIAHFRRTVDPKVDIPEMTRSLQWLYAQPRLPEVVAN